MVTDQRLSDLSACDTHSSLVPRELDDDADQASGHHDDLARCGPGEQLNHAGML
jgi:hypothetical protein